MNYKENLFFIGKCLTISQEEHNKILVKEELKSGKTDWDSVVKVSTAHFVFPALYCNLKRADFLSYLPSDLVNYMKHITDLNRERNIQIIEQAKEINELLLSNNITPIFLKGTGNLLEGLYEDIAERMVGDIDLLFSKEEYPKAIQLLHKHGYTRVHNDEYDPLSFRHYARIQKKGRIAAVEIHKEVIIEKFADEFNYNIIKNDELIIDTIHFLSYKNQINLSIIAKQINDSGFEFKNIGLRNAYDVYLLSKKTIAKNSFANFTKLTEPLNCFLAICYEVFNKPNSLSHNSTKFTKMYVNDFLYYISDEKKLNSHYKKTATKIFIKERLTIFYKSIFNKEYRNWLYKRVSDKKWQQEKLIQLGLKKPKADV